MHGSEIVRFLQMDYVKCLLNSRKRILEKQFLMDYAVGEALTSISYNQLVYATMFYMVHNKEP